MYQTQDRSVARHLSMQRCCQQTADEEQPVKEEERK